VTAIVSLALGIGVNTLVFSAFESLLLRPLPITDPERVVSVETGNGISHSFPNYKEFRDNTSTFNGLVGYRISPMSLERAGSAERIWGYLATGNYFDVLGVKPALGRFFHQQDDLQAGASPYAVLSYNSWQARFAADPRIVGKNVRINGLSYSVLGVAPRDFHGTELFYWPEIWVPMMMQAQIERGNAWLENPYTWDTWIVGRLKTGVTLSQAGADLNRIAGSLAQRFPDTDLGLSIRFSRPGLMGSAFRGPVRLFVGGLLLLAGLVLLTACTNLGGLLLARSADRAREMAIRISVGAGRARILRQLLTESLLLALAGGFAGYVLARVLLCRGRIDGYRRAVWFGASSADVEDAEDASAALSVCFSRFAGGNGSRVVFCSGVRRNAFAAGASERSRHAAGIQSEWRDDCGVRSGLGRL